MEHGAFLHTGLCTTHCMGLTPMKPALLPALLLKYTPKEVQAFRYIQEGNLLYMLLCNLLFSFMKNNKSPYIPAPVLSTLYAYLIFNAVR